MTRDLDILRTIGQLLVASGVAGGRIFESRGDGIGEDALPAIDLWLDTAQTEDPGRPVAFHELMIRLDVIARERDRSSALNSADLTLEMAHQALMADRTIGGRAANIRIDRRHWIYDSADGGYVRVECYYAVKYHTAMGSLAS